MTELDLKLKIWLQSPCLSISTLALKGKKKKKRKKKLRTYNVSHFTMHCLENAGSPLLVLEKKLHLVNQTKYCHVFKLFKMFIIYNYTFNYVERSKQYRKS